MTIGIPLSHGSSITAFGPQCIAADYAGLVYWPQIDPKIAFGLIRIEQSKARTDRHVMLSPSLLDLMRD